MALYLNNNLVTTTDDQRLVSKSDSKGTIYITWTAQPEDLYMVIMYDINAVAAPYVHLLAINVPGNDINKGLVIHSYQSPSPPPGTGRHVYIIDIYKQYSRLSPKSKQSRSYFDISSFVSTLNVTPIARLSFSVDADSVTPITLIDPPQIPPINIVPTSQPLQTPMVTPKLPKVSSDTISYKQGITHDERKYCDCLLKVQHKQGSTVNPYAICSHVGDRDHCGSKYDYLKTSDEFLTAFAELHELPIPQPYDRATLLNTIDLWKRQSGEPSIYS